MKIRKSTILSLIIGGGVIIASGFTAASSNGYAYATGSPSDGGDCSSCHSGGSATPVASITASPAFGGSGNNLTYTPGTTYTISVTQTATGYPDFGFDIEIMNSNSSSATTDAGTMTALSTTNCKNNGTGPTNVTHKTRIATGTAATIKWVAPSSGTAYLYASVLGVNANGGTSGDKVKDVAYILTPAATTPVPVAAFNTSSSSVCVGQSITLTDGSTNTPTSWAWTMTGGTPASSTVKNPTVSYSTAGTKTVTLVATNAGGNSAPVSHVITVNALPSVTANSPTICNGSSASLTAGGATTYAWSTGGSGASISVSPTTNTSYTVTGTTSGCSNTAIANVTVNPLPNVVATSTTICSGNSASLTASGATTYLWSTGGTSSTCVVSPTATTTYSVTGTAGGCSKTVTAVVTVNNCGAGIANYNTANMISIYPNPANEFLNIDLGLLTGTKTAQLYDISGRVVLEKNTEGSDMQLNLSDVSKGTYFIKVLSDKTVVAVKMILVSK